jgi:hypothetical protein
MLERSEREDAKLQRQLSTSELSPEVTLLLKKYKDRPFWCGSLEDPNPKFPCFMHATKLPTKWGKDQPLWDYQEEILDLVNGTNKTGINPDNKITKFLWIKKAIGVGISELFIRWVAWNGICRNEQFANTKCFIITGPAEATAIQLVNRLKDCLRQLGCPNLILDSDRTVCKFANMYCQTIPSDNLDRLRGWTDCKIVISDESDFYSASQQNTLREILESSMTAKFPGIFLILISSPNLPNGLFETIENAPNSIYHKVFIPYTRTVGKIYTEQEIEQASKGAGFERNFNLKYGYGTGNIILESTISKSIVDYPEPTAEELVSSVISIGVDEGYGSSKFACVSSAIIGGDKIRILSAQQYERISFSQSVMIVADIMRQYGYSTYSNNVKVFCDGSRPDFVRDLKAACGENPVFEPVVDYCHKYKIPVGNLMHIIPVYFGVDGKQMLAHLQGIASDGGLEIAPRYSQLLSQLRIAKVKPTGMLDKVSGNNSLDLVDGLMLSVWNVQSKT